MTPVRQATPLRSFKWDAWLQDEHQAQKPLRTKLPGSENRGVDSPRPEAPTPRSPCRSELKSAPSESGDSTRSDVLAASVPTQRLVYAMQRYDGGQYANRGVAA